MTALTRLLPGNSSRTRIQARIVPKIALTTTTISEQITVSSSADDRQRRGDLVPEGAEPPANASLTTAASGSSTITLR